LFELDFEKLVKLATEEIEFEEISPYPAQIRDISVFVPQDVLVESVVKKIQSVSPLILDVDLIDIYQTEEEERKSLTFRIIFQAKDRALDSKEVGNLMAKIIKVLEKDPNFEVRKGKDLV
jgi:phenylalanyl-tRNA synthetase beta chain